MWNLTFSRRWLSAGILCRIVWWKFTDVLGGTLCLHLQGRSVSKKKSKYSQIRLHSVTSQKMVLSNLKDVIRCGIAYCCRIVFRFHPLYSRGKSPRYAMDRKLGESQSRLIDDVERRKFLTLPELELRPLGRPARIQSLYRCNIQVTSLGFSAMDRVTILQYSRVNKINRMLPRNGGIVLWSLHFLDIIWYPFIDTADILSLVKSMFQ
jgi:hypothetical protein